MNIGIDIDDTISKTFEKTFPRAKQYLQEVLKREIPKQLEDCCFDHHFIENALEISEEEMRLFWEMNLVNLLETVEPKENVVEIINKLKKEGHNIIIITARWNSDYCNSDKISREWFKKYNIKYDKIYTDMQSKKQIAIDEKIDLFIDDSIRNCKEVSEAGIKCLLFRSEANSKNKEIKKFNVVDSWEEIYNKIKDGRI